MNLEALLDELRTNILRDDSELASGPNDSLWSDEALVRYINEAQTRWSRRTLALRDASTPEVTQFTLAAGVSTYELHVSILAVASARYDTDTVDLTRIGRSSVARLQVFDPPWWDPSTAESMTPGRPRAYSTDEALSVDTPSAVQLVVYPTPTVDEEGKTVYLRVARMPLETFSVDDLSMVCELPEEHQLDMLEWAAFRALRNSDIDGHSDMAKKHEERFTQAVLEVQRDLRRKLSTPIRWQFGQNGFAWDD